MVGCCVLCRSTPAAFVRVQICQPPRLCGRQCQRRPLLPPLTIAIVTATVDDDNRPKASGFCSSSLLTAAMTIIVDCSGGGNDIFANAVNNDDTMVADRPLLPSPPQPPPMLPPPPPRPCPCLHRHHCCSLCQRHCPSDAPVNGWLLCHLSPLTCCVIRHPNLSAPAVVWCVVDASSTGPPSPFADHRQPLSVALLLSIKRLCRSC